jgi:ABC-2 type transport system permease protein
VLRSTDRLCALFEREAADQALVFPADFGARMREPGGVGVQVITGTADPTTAGSVESYARGVIGAYEREENRALSPGVRPAGGRVIPEVRFRFNETLENQYLFVPGILAFVLTLVSALMTAITLSREKETGTLEALLVSPLRATDIILGKVLPYVGLAFVNAVTTLVVAYAVFGVPVRGSLLLLLAQSLLFVLVCLALGILIATRAPDQRTTLVATILITMLPTAIFSGMIFPVASMPTWLQPLTHVVPAKWFLRIVRGIMLREAGMDLLWQETAILAGMAGVFLTVSIRSFSERLE